MVVGFRGCSRNAQLVEAVEREKRVEKGEPAMKRLLLVIGLVVLVVWGYTPGQAICGTTAGQKRGEVWHGALMLTNVQAIDLADSPHIGCQFVAAVSFQFVSGSESVYKDVFPMFQHFGLTGTVFVTTALVGHSGYMTAEELKQLYAHGWEIGSAGVTGRQLSSLSAEDAKNEIRDSSAFLQSLGFKVSGFFPSGPAPSPQIIQIIRSSYRYALGDSGLGNTNTLPLRPEERYGLSYSPLRTPLLDAINQMQILDILGGWLIINFQDNTYPFLEDVVRFARQQANLCTLQELMEGRCPVKSGG